MVKLDNAVAVVATDTFWRAKRALSRLQPEWDVGAAGKVDSEQLSKEYRAALDEPMLTARNDGNVDQAFSGAAKTFEAIYETPYLSHSPMEPMNATVNLQPDRLDVWVGTQAADGALEAAAKASGLKPEQVYIHNGFVGGGFGRRDANDEVRQAIAIAKAVQRPVKLVWTREEDTRQDKFRPHAVVAFKAVGGADGMPTAWSMRVVTSSIWASVGRPFSANKVEPQAVDGLADNGYNVPNTRVEAVIKNTHLPVWFWRAPGVNQHVFAIESFLDEIATANGLDPYQMRRKLLAGKPDWLKVLDTAAEKGDWGKPLPAGTGRGIAICEDDDSLCAQVAEVTVKPNGEVKVDRVTVALDPRYMVNPLTIAEQAEGIVIFGLSAALYGKITIKDGAAVQGNFDTYRMVRLAEAPKIDVHLMPSGGKVWGGIAEVATGPISAAVANAIFAATGKRIRTLPISDHDLSRVGVAGAFDNRRGGGSTAASCQITRKQQGRRLRREAEDVTDNFEGRSSADCCCSSQLATSRADENTSPPTNPGEYLARAGDCVSCHSAPGGKAFAGGLKMGTPLGAIYSTNITPDPETGIGGYTP